MVPQSKNMLCPWPVPLYHSAPSNKGNKEYGLPKMVQAVPARMYIWASFYCSVKDDSK